MAPMRAAPSAGSVCLLLPGAVLRTVLTGAVLSGAVLTGAVLPGAALAGEAAPEPVPLSPPLPASGSPIEPPPERYQEGYIWIRIAPPLQNTPLTGIAVGPAGWLAGDAWGSVSLSTDGGRSWETVIEGRRAARVGTGLDGGLDGGLDEEELLLEAEQAQEESVEEETSGDVIDLDAVDASVQASVQSSAQLSLERAQREGRQNAGALRHAGPWWSPLPGASGSAAGALPVAIATRSDGIWRSQDGGNFFVKVNDTPATDVLFSRIFPDAIAAGTVDGVLFSFDNGLTWDDVEDATDGADVRALIEVGDRVLAATDRGVFTTRDAFRWERLPALGEQPVQTLLPDPDWPGGFWAAIGGGLLRTDDGGATFYPAGRQPMRGLRGLRQVMENHLVAWGEDGVWESLDGGVKWQPVSHLLTDPDVRDLEIVDGLPLIATASGLWWLVVRPPERPDVPPPVGMSLNTAVSLAWRRSGLDVSALSLARRRLAATVAPQMGFTFGWNQGAARKTEFLDYSTAESHDANWDVGLSLCWGGCGSAASAGTSVDESTGTYYDSSGNEISADDLDGGLFVMDGEVFSDTQVVAAAANIQQNLQRYQNQLYGMVAEAWTTRRRLLSETPAIRTLSLEQQVEHTLKIQELEARLDIYTEGAFSQSLSTDPSNTPSPDEDTP